VASTTARQVPSPVLIRRAPWLSTNTNVTMSPTATTGMTFEKSADSLERLILVARHIFTQALEFVDLLESDEKLTGDSKYLPGSTIGIVCQQSHLGEIG
jgi:hypothetical protein